jgi:hypothetical protein
MKKTIIATIFAFLNISIWAEYRVYQYFVKSKNRFGLDQSAYLVTSSLDPVSYISYHGGASALKVDLIRTWMCYGHTGKKPICSPPLESTDKKGAAN